MRSQAEESTVNVNISSDGGAACYGPLVVSSSHNACPEILFRNGIIGHRELVRSGISYSPLDNNVK